MLISLDEVPTLVGRELGVSGWHTVDQELIDRFADVTRDHQWIHVDRARAALSPIGSTIAHGFLLLSMLPSLAAEVYEMDSTSRINYGLGRVRFPYPVPAGSRVRDRVTLAAVEQRRTGLLVTTTHVLEVEGGPAPAVAADYLVLLALPGPHASG